jgi:F-type H+-transporting ATPase subunit delta
VTGRLAKRYARAAFELAREEGKLGALGEELGRAVAAFEDSRVRLLLLNPGIDAGARLGATKQVVAALGLSPTVANLIALLAERERLAILPDIARWYDDLLDAELGRIRVTITSSAPLGTAEKNDLVELARRLTGRREVLASIEVDADLLGGVLLDAGGTVYDGSLRAQLARLRKEMAEGVV